MKKETNIVIVEDELHNQRLLSGMIAELRPQWKIAAVISSVKEGVEYFSQSAPDLIFMDVQLQDGVCFSIFEKVNVESPVIFTTAFDNYAIQAFKVNSIDYLLKPIKETELENAILKFENRNYFSQKQNPVDYSEILNAIKTGETKYRKRFLVSAVNGFYKLDVKEIAYFYSENKVTSAVTYEKKEHALETTLEALEEELDPAEFFRANRSTIVHIDSIVKIENYFGGKLYVKLLPKLNTEIIVSRLKNMAFRNWIEK
jgi:DNA-binding LytR/AlgR family response regulator